MHSSMNDDPAKFSLSNFLAGESNDPLQAPASFTNWMRLCAWAAELYAPELLASAYPRTVIDYRGKPRPVFNPCSDTFFAFANHSHVFDVAPETQITPRNGRGR